MGAAAVVARQEVAAAEEEEEQEGRGRGHRHRHHQQQEQQQQCRHHRQERREGSQAAVSQVEGLSAAGKLRKQSRPVACSHPRLQCRPCSQLRPWRGTAGAPSLPRRLGASSPRPRSCSMLSQGEHADAPALPAPIRPSQQLLRLPAEEPETMAPLKLQQKTGPMPGDGLEPELAPAPKT